MTNGTTNNPPQHITTAFVGGHYTIHYQKSTGTDVVGDNPQGGITKIFFSGQFGNGRNKVLKQVDIVIVMHTLQHGGKTLQAHTGIHGGMRQQIHVTCGITVKLHEHKVPNFDVTVTVFFRRTRRASGYISSMVVKNFRAGATGAGIAHGPEVIAFVFFTAGFVANTRETRRVNTYFVQPDVSRFVVFRINGNPQAICWQLDDFGQKFPGKLNGFAFEIITKTEVTQHLEKGVVTGSVANIFQIIVFATGTYTALRTDGAFITACVLPGKDFLELHHACIGEQQGGVIGGHQRAAGH